MKIASMMLAGLLTISSSVYALDSFANFFSISSQPLSVGEAATFDLANSNKNIDISIDRTTVELVNNGQYLITFTATGSQSDGATQYPGPWSVGLYRNGGLIVGSVAASHSGTDFDDNLITLTTEGQVIINGSPGDQLQIRNTSSVPISLIGTVSGGVVQNTSVSINVVQVE